MERESHEEREMGREMQDGKGRLDRSPRPGGHTNGKPGGARVSCESQPLNDATG